MRDGSVSAPAPGEGLTPPVAREPSLGVSEATALVARALDGEPGVFRRRHELGTLHFLRGSRGGLIGRPYAFTIATEGGLLVRPAPEEVDQFLRQDNLLANHAFPQWVIGLAEELAGADSPSNGGRPLPGFIDLDHTLGGPDRWIWIPIADESSFQRRLPLVMDSLGYARHQFQGTGVVRADPTFPDEGTPGV